MIALKGEHGGNWPACTAPFIRGERSGSCRVSRSRGRAPAARCPIPAIPATHRRLRPVAQTVLTLYDFQHEGVAALCDRPRLLLLDDPGLGKTVQVVEALRQLDAKRVLVLAPATTLDDVWRRTFETWWPECNARIVAGPERRRWPIWEDDAVRVWITTYQTFLNDQDELIDRWGCLVCDEVQNVRGRKTKQFPVLRRHARNARRFIGLTGSPLWKTPSDLWTALHLIDAQRWRGFWSFVRQYCHVSWSGFNWHVGGLRAGMAEALMGDVADVCVRRTREDVARQIWGRRGLPTVQVQQQWVKLDLPTRAVYDGLRSNLRTTLPSGKAIVALNFASTTALLEQLTYDWSLLDGRYGDDLLECPKIQACLDIVAKMGSRQFVVYTVVKSALARLKRTLEARKIACALIDGSTDRQGRLQALCDFREGRVRGLLATVLVGGVGITLTSAADIIMLDREWAPEANAQAVDRCVRIGQASRVVRVWLVGADQTIDKRKDAVLAHREVDISAVKEGLAQAWKDRTL